MGSAAGIRGSVRGAVDKLVRVREAFASRARGTALVGLSGS